MAKITVTAITWDDPQPDSFLQVLVSWRLTSSPDVPSSYHIVSTGTFVDTNGEFLIPVVIDGLDITKGYTVKVVSLCGGYSATRDFVYQNDGAFTIGFSLGFES